MSINSVWLPKIKTALRWEILAHFTWVPNISCSLSLSDVYFDIIILNAVRPTVNFYNPVVTLLTQGLSSIPRSAHTVYLCVLRGSENKQRLFPYTTLTDWFL